MGIKSQSPTRLECVSYSIGNFFFFSYLMKWEVRFRRQTKRKIRNEMEMLCGSPRGVMGRKRNFNTIKRIIQHEYLNVIYLREFKNFNNILLVAKFRRYQRCAFRAVEFMKPEPQKYNQRILSLISFFFTPEIFLQWPMI